MTVQPQFAMETVDAVLFVLDDHIAPNPRITDWAVGGLRAIDCVVDQPDCDGEQHAVSYHDFVPFHFLSAEIGSHN
jgi:hypothetical protein